MAQATPASRPPAFWLERLYAAAPLAPGWVGLGLALGLWALFFAIEWALGRQPFPRHGGSFADSGETLITLVLCAALAYVATASACVVRDAPRTVAELRPLLAGEPHELDALERDAARVPRGVLLAVGALGVAIGLGVPYLEIDDTNWRPHDWRQWSPEVAWHRILTPLLGWWITRLVAWMLATSLRLSRLAERIARIDLLDLAPLAPFVRKGLANTFWLAGLVGFVSLMLLDASRYGGVMALLIPITLLAAAAALLLPVNGVHRRIRAAKLAELERVNAALRGDGGALAQSGLAARGDPVSVADLVAYRGLVEGVREWPFGAPTLARFALYLLIPVGSWAGGALAERVIDALLD